MAKGRYDMTTILIHHQFYKLQIEKMKRKTIALSLPAPNTLSLRLPLQISNHEIKKILLEKSDWIQRHNAQLCKNENSTVNQSLNDGDLVLFKGQSLRLCIYNTIDQSSIQLSGPDLILKTMNSSTIAAQLKTWYVKQSLAYLTAQSIAWCKTMNVKINRLTIKDQKTRWGSCSIKGNINYNWRIIMAPLPVIDYLLIHELSHLIHLNHSTAFWKLVETYCPNFKEQRNWLKVNGYMLSRLFPK